MSAPSPRIVVLDPGFEHIHAHHLAVNGAIADAAQAAGRGLMVVAARTLDVPARRACLARGIPVASHWSTPGYPRDADHLPTDEHERLAAGFADEVQALFSSGFVQWHDDLHLHTGYSFHLEGLARALWRLQKRFAGRVLLSMMFHPGHKPGEDGGRMLDARELSRHRRAFATMAATPGLAVALATSCRAYQRAYARVWPRSEVLLHPAVVARPRRPALASRGSARPRVLLFVGGPKANKGLLFSAEVGAQAAVALPHLEFVFHFNTGFPGSEVFRPQVERLRQAGHEHGNVVVLEGALDDAEYDHLVVGSDAVCLFYDPAEYTFKTSGVLWDLLSAQGLRWLVSGGTWLADELAEIGLPHQPVPYGDVAAALEALRSLFDEPADARQADGGYLDALQRPYGQWLLEQLPAEQAAAPAAPPPPLPALPAVPAAARALRILVVRTQYGHFSPLSGPGGFIPHLRTRGHTVDEWAVPLGHDAAWKLPPRIGDPLLRRAQARLRSFQGNAIPFETRLQAALATYDVVHFLDAEHAGLLTASARLSQPRAGHARLVATFHQPASVMQQLAPAPGFVAAFDRIHLMAPSQRDFFLPHVAAERLRVVPHGLAPELMLPELPQELAGPPDEAAVARLAERLFGCRVLLCVGSWLRDHDALLQTAALLQGRPECVFVVVGKGLQLDTRGHPNVLLLNEGLPDDVLHMLYRRATALFLPLADAAANNAVLEAMARGLPIVTTDLPATRYYTRGCALFCPPEPRAYAAALEHWLELRQDPALRGRVTDALRERAAELAWPRIAAVMDEALYAA